MWAIFLGTLCVTIISSKSVFERFAIFVKTKRMILRNIKSNKKTKESDIKTRTKILHQSEIDSFNPAEISKSLSDVRKYSMYEC